MTIFTMENRKSLIKEMLGKPHDTNLLDKIREFGDSTLNKYLSDTRLHVINALSRGADLDRWINLLEELDDQALIVYERQDRMSKLENWCSTNGDCELYDNIINLESAINTGAALTAAKEIMSITTTNSIKGFLTNPQANAVKVINTEPASSDPMDFTNWMLIGGLITLAGVITLMLVNRHEIRKKVTSIKDTINRSLFGNPNDKAKTLDEADVVEAATLHIA